MDRSISGAGGGRRTGDRARARALRVAVRRAHARDEKLGDARDDGAHRAAGRDLARRRAAGHDHVCAGAVREADGRGRRPESTARALQYGPTEGMAVTVECIVEVMAAEGTAVDPDEVIVTTGGQQVIDLVCKALIDPRRRDRRRGADLPGRGARRSAPIRPTWCRSRWTATGMPIDALEATLDQLAREGRRPKFIYTIPNFQNPGGVTMSLARRRRLVQVARERELLGARGQSLWPAALRGRAAPDALFAGCRDGGRQRRRGPGDLPRHVLEDPLARSAPRMGGRAASRTREAQPGQTGLGPVLLAGHAAVRRRLLQRA